MSPTSLPIVIQGGMGIGVSSWQLASKVSGAGQLGVVSGTALDTVWSRRLQDGDPEGHARAALADFPLRDVAERILAKWFKPQGRQGDPYIPVPRLGVRGNRAGDELTVASNFIEVWLAKRGHGGQIGINFLEKIQMATPAAAYGAMLAGVDFVLMGAGIPRQIPSLLDALAAGQPGGVDVDVAGGSPVRVEVDPASLTEGPLPAVRRPMFLAIVSSNVLAAYLARDEITRPDGFVVEGPTAGGHNAPPRGKLVLDDDGQPVYGPRDEVKLDQLAAIGLPFWLAGGYGEPEQVRAALAAGASGVQVGTLFALSRDSGLTPKLRGELLRELRAGTLRVTTDASASPTGFPFKVAAIEGTLSQPEVYAARPRLCDLGYLREPYQREGGGIGFRCPAEPIDVYVRKGGDAAQAAGAKCLCNALAADIGLGQERRDGYHEAPLITMGADLAGARRLDAECAATADPGDPDPADQGAEGTEAERPSWSAEQAVAWLLREVRAVGADPAPEQIAEPNLVSTSH